MGKVKHFKDIPRSLVSGDRIHLHLTQGSANFFCKGPNSKYFSFYRPKGAYYISVDRPP